MLVLEPLVVALTLLALEAFDVLVLLELLAALAPALVLLV